MSPSEGVGMLKLLAGFMCCALPAFMTLMIFPFMMSSKLSREEEQVK